MKTRWKSGSGDFRQPARQENANPVAAVGGRAHTDGARVIVRRVPDQPIADMHILDEAEAALDESNIERFCGLVETIARETGTRFLIITHQRLTMARMDRLYGVTMGEKGVSQLVSVDLEAAVAIRDGSAAEEALRGVQAA